MTVFCKNDVPGDQGITAIDNCGEMLEVVFDQSELPDCDGSVINRWTTSDCAGNVTTYTQVILILENQAPVFDSQPSAIGDISCNDNLPIQEILTASDLCGVTNVTASVDDFIVDNCNGYAITYRWVASDDCGNETTVSTVFNVLPDSSCLLYTSPSPRD